MDEQDALWVLGLTIGTVLVAAFVLDAVALAPQ